MSINFARAAAENRNYIENLGAEKTTFEDFIAKNILEQYGFEFRDALQKLIRERDVTNTGQLSDRINVKVIESGNKKTLQVFMLDYFDYVNKGVKGVQSAKNAAGSPYQYKNYGMNAAGRKNIKQLIQSGRAKVQNVKVSVGTETKKKSNTKKRKSLIDMQTDELIYLIKRYGIKKTEYFDDAVEMVFKNFADDMAKAYGEDIKYNLQIKRGKK